MIVFFNGRYIPGSRASVSVFDRSFLYGDGLFETVRVRKGSCVRLSEHVERLRSNAAMLKIKLPFAPGRIAKHAVELIRRNRISEGALRITLSRGVGARGYSARGADKPSFVMTLCPSPAWIPGEPQRVRLVTSPFRIPAADALSQVKSANRLLYVLARTDAEERGADEALLLDARGNVIEASSANVFWLRAGKIFTPPLDCCGLAGITRANVMGVCAELGSPVKLLRTSLRGLQKADAIFLTNSIGGVTEVAALDGRKFSASPVVREIHRAFCGQV